MRRYLTPDEETSVGAMDATTPEESDASLVGVSVPEWRDLAKPEKGPMAALDRATFAARNPVGPPTEEETNARSAGLSLKDWRALSATSASDVASPIPVAAAPVKADVPGAVKTAIPATTPTQPAPPAGASSTVKPPSIDAGSGGDDDVRNLYLARLAAQSAAGFGGMGAGKNIDMGIADTLGERMKQIEALRAKRQERSMELARGKAEAAAASKVTGEMLQSLGITPPSSLAELPSAEAVLKAGKFPAEVAGIQALTAQRAAGADVAKARLPLLGGQVALTDARTQNLLNKDLRDERAMQLREEAQDSMNELRKAQAESARAAALKAKNDPKAAEAAVNSVKKTVEASRKLVTPTANNFLAIERIAPNMARGEAPSWLTREAMAGTQISKEIAPKVADLNAAVEALVMDIRHGTFGASLTGTEKASFEQLITNSIKDGPEALARALSQLRLRAAQIAQDHFSFDMDFHPQETARALQASNVWKQVLGEGGVYSDVWQLPEAPTSTATEMTRMRGTDGLIYNIPTDKVADAEKDGFKRE
jgi:hypothetical protein